MMKSILLGLLVSIACLTGMDGLQAQSCSSITWSVIKLEPCKYRLHANSETECYPFVRMLIDIGTFENVEANVAEGWTAELVSSMEILLTHESGFIPFGESTPVEFELPFDIAPLITFLWDYACPLEESCVFEFQTEACVLPCSGITYSFEHYEPCKFRFACDNSSECYSGLNIILSEGSFVTWEANVQQGWSAELISPIEIALIHDSGIIPLGSSLPIDFSITPGINPLVSILWNYTCSPGESCLAELPLQGCPIIAEACIEGVVYFECEDLPFMNQDVLSDWTVELLDDMGNVTESEVTGLDGAYSFCDLPAGSYVVRVGGKPGWTARVPISGQYALMIDDTEYAERHFGVCQDCFCAAPTFSNMILRSLGNPDIPIQCETAYENIGCPESGDGFSFTGLFECAGDSCIAQSIMHWDLLGPDGNSVGAGSYTGPYFAINLLPTYFLQAGIYTMKLTGFCGFETCSCEFQLVIDCPDLCPCEQSDVEALEAAVNAGFSNALWYNSCNTCFAPMAVSDCESVAWYVDDIMGSLIGTSLGTESFCHDFANPGTYTIIMVVNRKKTDGTDCETFSKTQTVTITCQDFNPCLDAVIDNPTFSEGAIAGGFHSGGASQGWATLSGEPVVIEGAPGSDDGWTIQLTGNLDTTDILVMSEPVCLTQSKGIITSKHKVEHWGDPHENLNGKHIKDWEGKQRLFIGDNLDVSECDGINCFELGSINYSLADTGWIEYQIPYDLSLWLDADTCIGSGGSDQMIEARLAIFVTSPYGNNQGGMETRARIQIDDVCFNEILVSIPLVKDLGTFQIYPNPNDGKFTVELSSPATQGLSLQVIGLMGEVLVTTKAVAGTTIQTVDTNYLPQGMYLLQIVSDRRVMSVNKFVKQ